MLAQKVGMDSVWPTVAAQLLKISWVATQEYVSVEDSTVVGAAIQTFENSAFGDTE